MRSRGGRTIRVTPVDEDPHVQDHPDRGRIEALFDQNLFKLHIRRERSSAYWFAASIWGVSGLVMGSILGGFMMYAAMDSSLPLASEAMSRGMAVEAARQRVESRPPIIGEEEPSDPQQ